MSLRSTMARPTLTPALNVFSATAPVLRLRSFVRTNAPPLPGFTCWNSMTWNSVPSSSRVMPFFNSFVETLTDDSLLAYSSISSRVDVPMTRHPSSPTSTMSSIRTPPSPGT